MSDNSAIEWTDATWNPVTGCTKITRGCDHCYAERIAERFRGTPGHPFENWSQCRTSYSVWFPADQLPWMQYTTALQTEQQLDFPIWMQFY